MKIRKISARLSHYANGILLEQNYRDVISMTETPIPVTKAPQRHVCSNL